MVVDHLHRNPPGLRSRERAAFGAVQRRPGILVDLGAQRCLQPLERILAAKEIGVANEEALLVVVGVDEPAGDVLTPLVRTSPVVGSNTSTPLISTCELAVDRPRTSMSGSPNTTNRLPAPVFFSSGMRRSWFMRAFSTGAGRGSGSRRRHAPRRRSRRRSARRTDRRLARGPRTGRLVTVPYSGPMKIAARRSLPWLLVAPLGMHEAGRAKASGWRTRAARLLGVLHARGLRLSSTTRTKSSSPLRDAQGCTARRAVGRLAPFLASSSWTASSSARHPRPAGRTRCGAKRLDRERPGHPRRCALARSGTRQ